MHLNLPYAGITKFEYLTGDAEGLIVGPDLISCLNGDPWCTIGCWIGLAKSEFEFWFAVFKSAPTIKSTGLAEPCPLFFVRWGKTCWFSGDCWVRSGGLIVFNAENRIRYRHKNVSAKDWEFPSLKAVLFLTMQLWTWNYLISLHKKYGIQLRDKYLTNKAIMDFIKLLNTLDLRLYNFLLSSFPVFWSAIEHNN